MNARVIFAALACLVVIVPRAPAQGLSALYDANDMLIGEYVESVSGVPIVHNVRGFRFAVRGQTGQVISAAEDVAGTNYGLTQLYYASPDCTGDALALVTSVYFPAGGMILVAGSRGIHYIERTPTVIQINPASAFNANANMCEPDPSSSLIELVPALPNDPGVTGIPNTPYAVPLRIEPVPLSAFFEIFKSGFESSAVSGSDTNLMGIA